jgi:hypothetical protein
MTMNMKGVYTQAQIDTYQRVRTEFLSENPMGYTDFSMDDSVMLIHCGGVKSPQNLLVRRDGTVTVNR